MDHFHTWRPLDSIHVEGGAQECFYQDFKPEQTVNFLFECSEGEDFIIRASVTAPDGKSLYDHVSQEDFLTFTTTQEGEHAFCFGNEMSSAQKKLNFNIMLEEEDGDDMDGAFRNLTALAENNPLLAATASAVNLINLKVQNATRLLDAKALRMHRHIYLAEALLARVTNYGYGRGIAAVVWALASVLVIRSFFSQRNSYVGGRHTSVGI